MTKRHSAKHKIDRRLGENLWGRAKSPVNRRPYPPGMHGKKRKKISDYGVQLRGKQKMRFYYNVGERQFRNIYEEASRLRGDTGENLIALLESRLDALVYRAKLAPTIFAARQFVSHGHIQVNGKRVNIPSYRLRAGDTVKLSDKLKDKEIIADSLVSGERDVPEYIVLDVDHLTATYTRVPQLNDVPYPVKMEPNLVIEYYSR